MDGQRFRRVGTGSLFDDPNLNATGEPDTHGLHPGRG